LIIMTIISNVTVSNKNAVAVSVSQNEGITISNTSAITTITNVIVADKRSISVSSNAIAGIINTTTPVTLIPTPTMASGASTLESLTDVVSTGETTGDTLVYDSNTKTWIAQPLDLSNVTGGLDGGTF